MPNSFTVDAKMDTPNQQPSRVVAIVGAGASGLAAAKALKEENIDYVILEKTGRLGGLWNYRDDDVEGEACVMKSTVINSSKEMSAFSDFPPPKEFPNYMHNSKMLQYFVMYAEKFKLLDNIKYHTEVEKVEQAEDYDDTGSWIVTTKCLVTKTIDVVRYSGVMVCTGHHGFPYSPQFEGQEDFGGKIIHSHSLKVPDAFKDQSVLVIGVGNSGLDAAVELSNVCKQVYLSTRRGTWIMFRLGSKGLPLDTQLLTRWFMLQMNVFGWTISNAYVERWMNSRFDHATYNLKPKHHFNSQHLAINDHLPNKILSGTVIVKGDVSHFTTKGVVFDGAKSVTQLDSVILATGYNMKYPFLSKDIVDTTNNDVPLFKYVFPPHLKYSTLAFIGMIQPFGSLFPIFEAQSRWYAQLFNKKTSLPSENVMRKDIALKKYKQRKRYVGTQRHTIQVDFIEYMDEICSMIGAKPNLLKIALSDPILFYHLAAGPGVPYQYRLQGPHSWTGARKAILTTKERILCPLNTRNNVKKRRSFELTEAMYIASAFMVFLALILAYVFRALRVRVTFI